MQTITQEIRDTVNKALSNLKEKMYEISDLISWKMRMKRHVFWQKVTRIAIKFLALSILKRSNIYVRHMKRYKKPPEIKKLAEYKEQALYRRIGGKYINNTLRYNTEMKVSEFTFWGKNETEVYIDIITRLMLDQMHIPFCVNANLMRTINHQRYKNYKTKGDE